MSDFDALVNAFLSLCRADEHLPGQHDQADHAPGGTGSPDALKNSSFKMPNDDEVKSLTDKVLAEVEARVSNRYHIDQSEDGTYRLRDKTKAGFGGSEWPTVASGSRADVEKALKAKVKSAKTKVSKDIKGSIDGVASTVSQGFYDAYPEGAQLDLMRATDPEKYLKSYDFTFVEDNGWKTYTQDQIRKGKEFQELMKSYGAM